MRHALLFAGLGVMAGAALAGCQKKAEPPAAAPQAAASPAAGMPHRKPGLWAQTVAVAGMKQTTRICLDADSDAKMALWGQDLKGGGDCRRQTATPIPGGVAFESVCDAGDGGHVVAKGTATGDFSAKYVVKASTTTTGAAIPKADGVHAIQIDAEYKGPCPPDMKGGDIAIEIPGSGGQAVNLRDIQQLADKYRRHAGK